MAILGPLTPAEQPVNVRLSNRNALLCVVVALTASALACARNAPEVLEDGGQAIVIPTRIPNATPLPPLPTAPPTGSAEDPLMFRFVTDAAGTSSRAASLVESFSEVEPELVFEVDTQDDQLGVVEALCQGEVDVATLDALAALGVQERGCAEPLYLLEVSGETFTQSQLITATARGIAGVTAFAAQDFCRTDPYSISGWVVPSLRIREAELDPLTQLNSVVTVEDDQEVIERVFNFTCDVGATAVGAEQETTSIDPDAIRVLEILPPVPNNAIVVSSRLEPAISALLRDLIRDHTDQIADIHAADDLVIVSESDYDELEALLESAEVSLLELAQ